MKFSTLLIAPVLALGATAQILNRDFAIEGCVGLSTVLNPALGILGSAITGQLFTTESACADACRARGFNYAFFLGGQVLSTVTSCACSNNAPQLSQYVSATAAVDGALTGGVCGTLNAESINLNTDFSLRACAAANAFTNTATGPSSTQGTVASCLASCGAFAYAILNSANGLCTCATGTSITNAAGLGVCSRTGNSNQIYFNGIFPVASRTARKRDFEASKQKTLGLCPTGLQACLVDQNSAVAGQDAFECIDTRSELESCGGCTNGYADIVAGVASIGTDCSSLPGVALGGSTCTYGKCEIFACKKGHALVNGKCARV